VSAIKYLRLCFVNLQEADQHQLVALVFQGLPRWETLIQAHHQSAPKVFQAISQFFKEVINTWAHLVYTGNGK